MTQSPGQRDAGLPPWVALVAIILCIAAGVWVVWLFLGHDAPVVGERVEVRGGASQADRARFLQLVAERRLDEARSLLAEKKELAHHRDTPGGATLLHQMAWAGDLDVITMLLDAGADIEATDEVFQGTPLSWAIVAGQDQAVELLLSRKAAVHPAMGDLIVGGLSGDFTFAQGTPEGYRRIAQMLRAQGIEPARMMEVGFLTSLWAEEGVDPASAEGVRQIEGDRAAQAAMPVDLYAFCPATWMEEGLQLTDQRHRTGVMTGEVYQPPIRITVEARTDSTNIRLYYARGMVVLGWEVNPQQLFYQEPTTAAPVVLDDRGEIEPGTWHTIVWTITATDSILEVDGERRLTRAGEYGDVRGRVAVGPAWGSTVTVRRLEVERSGD